MKSQRWLWIIPVAVIMYTISYVDRTNISLALDPKISSMMKDLLMDDKLKGEAAGIFFIGYMMLQIPGGHLAMRWSARKVVSLCLIGWGVCAVGCGLSHTFRQFEVMRFFLGVAESAVYPATLVLLYHWFPRPERARATACWNLCQPLAVAGSAPVTGWLLGHHPRIHQYVASFGGSARLIGWIASLSGWQRTLILEGALPFLWLPIWWFCVRDHPREAKWVSTEERDMLESALSREAAEMEPGGKMPLAQRLLQPSIFVMVALYFLHNCAAYGCMTFFTDRLKNRGFSPVQYGCLFAVPYVITAVVMLLNSWHSDKTRERRGHVAIVYAMSGISLILSVVFAAHFWLAYALLCLAIPGPFSGMAPFWANASETMPRSAMAVVVGLVNAVGNVGGFVGPYFVGWLTKAYHSTGIPFIYLGVGMLGCTALAFLLPKAKAQVVEPVLRASPTASIGGADRL